MNKLLLTVSTVSLLFAANLQSAHAEGIGDWFKGIFSSEESIDSDAEMHDETDVGHEAMGDPYDDNEKNYTPYEKELESKTKETQGHDNATDKKADTEEDDDDTKEPAPMDDTGARTEFNLMPSAGLQVGGI